MPGHSNHYYNKNLQPYANRLRKDMTKAEACLWKYVLRASQLKGFPFRRQRSVLNYIADFMCKELMLIIEVDGGYHLLKETAEKDTIRQKALESAGFTVLRFTNEEVLTNIRNVYDYLEDWIEKKLSSSNLPLTVST
jgi:very-short-patch-repair endonuclease